GGGHTFRGLGNGFLPFFLDENAPIGHGIFWWGVGAPLFLPRRRPAPRPGRQLPRGGGLPSLLPRHAPSTPPPSPQFLHCFAAERIADGDPEHPSILIDAQTHVWWRAGGIRQMSERSEHFLKSLAGSRAGVVGHPVPIADMGRVMFLEDVFLGSPTDIAFLNS